MGRWGALAFFVGVFCASAAWGAPLVQVKSEQILVNCGSGYRAVANFSEVQPGCMVMASAETGHGYILYSDCDVEVSPGSVHTVKEDPGPEDAKGFRPICKKVAPWWLVGAAVPIALCYAATDCFEGDGGPASP